jgi:hypothetical protein
MKSSDKTVAAKKAFWRSRRALRTRNVRGVACRSDCLLRATRAICQSPPGAACRATVNLNASTIYVGGPPAYAIGDGLA